MTKPDNSPRSAEESRNAFDSGEANIETRPVPRRDPFPDATGFGRAKASRVIAREQGGEICQMQKSAPEILRSDRVDRAERLKMALFFGRNREVESLLSETPDLGSENFGLLCALFDADGVRRELDRAPLSPSALLAGHADRYSTWLSPGI